jgi:hypothetical protein
MRTFHALWRMAETCLHPRDKHLIKINNEFVAPQK